MTAKKPGRPNAPNPFAVPRQRAWIPWAIGASLCVGAGSLAGSVNTCNFVNTGTQVIQSGSR